MVIDRGPVGYKLFDKLFERDTKLGNQDFIYQARKICKNKDFTIVYCTCDVATALERIKAHNEECPYDYAKAQKMYKDDVRRYYRPDKLVVVDTTNTSIEDCVKLIVEKLEEVQRGEL